MKNILFAKSLREQAGSTLRPFIFKSINTKCQGTVVDSEVLHKTFYVGPAKPISTEVMAVLETPKRMFELEGAQAK